MKEAMGGLSGIGSISRGASIGTGVRLGGGLGGSMGRMGGFGVEGGRMGMGFSTTVRSGLTQMFGPELRVGGSSVSVINNPFSNGPKMGERSSSGFGLMGGLNVRVIENPFRQTGSIGSELGGVKSNDVNFVRPASVVVDNLNKVGSGRFNLGVRVIQNPFQEGVSRSRIGRERLRARLNRLQRKEYVHVPKSLSEAGLNPGIKPITETRANNLPNDGRVARVVSIKEFEKQTNLNNKPESIQRPKTRPEVVAAKQNLVDSRVQEGPAQKVQMRESLIRMANSVKETQKKTGQSKSRTVESTSILTAILKLLDRMGQVAPAVVLANQVEARVKSKSVACEQTKTALQEQAKEQTEAKTNLKKATELAPTPTEVETIEELVEEQEEARASEEKDEKVQVGKFMEHKEVTIARRMQLLVAIKKAFSLAVYYGRNKIFGLDVVRQIPNQMLETTSALRVKPNGEFERDGSFEAWIKSMGSKEKVLESEAVAQEELEKEVVNHIPVKVALDNGREASIDEVLKVVRPPGEEHNLIPGILKRVKRIFRRKVVEYQANRDISSQTEEIVEQNYGD